MHRVVFFRRTDMNLLNKVRNYRSANDNCYLVHIRFTDRVLGGQPASEAVMRKWLEGKFLKLVNKGDIEAETANALLEKQVEEMGYDNVVDEEERGNLTTFKSDDQGIYIGTYQVQAMLKELLSSLGLTVAKKGIKQTREHLTEVAACTPDFEPLTGAQRERLRLYKDGKVVTEPEDYEELCAHVHTPQGDKNALKQHHYVQGADMYFLIYTPTVKTLSSRKKTVLTPDDVVALLSYGENDAIGCSRSQGYGKFEVLHLELREPGVPASGRPKTSSRKRSRGAA